MRAALALLLVLFASGAAATTTTHLVTEDCNFGETYAFNSVDCELTFSNTGGKTIHVSDFQPERPDDSVAPGAVVIAPHATVYVKAVVNTGNDVGGSRHIFRFHSDEPGHEKRLVMVRGFVMSVLDPNRPMIDFGVVTLSAKLPSKTVDLRSHDVADFRVVGVESSPAYLDTRLAPDGRSVTISVRGNAPWGYRGDYVKLRTNSDLQKQIWVGVQADIHGNVVPSSNPFNLGLMRTGNPNAHLIQLTSRDGKDFRVGAIELENLRGLATIAPCEPAAAGCKLIRLTFSDDQPQGSVVGKLLVSLPDASQQLLIAVHGLLLDKDTKIEKLDTMEIEQANAKRHRQSRESDTTTDIGRALRNAVKPSEEAPAGHGPLLKWTVSNEELLHGYQVFRAPREQGPFLLLNRKTIPVKRHDGVGSSYQWRDNSAVSGKTYWYYIGVVYNDGHKQQLSGPQKVIAK